MMSDQTWLLKQLGGLTYRQPENFNLVVGVIRRELPDEFEEMVLGAVDCGDLSVENASELMLTDEAGLDSKLEIYRQEQDGLEVNILIETNERGVAEISGTKAKVWEIVLKFRELGSLEALQSSYLGLTQSELKAALRYSDRYPDEIERQIEAFRKVNDRLKAAYPFGN